MDQTKIIFVSRIVIPASLLLGSLLWTGCSFEQTPDNPYVRNMNDFSYSGQVTPGKVIRRVNASGDHISIGKYKGRFVWADYAAPWCGPCAAQAPVIKGLEKKHYRKVIFLTVMTSKSTNYGDVPDQGTAKAWATRFSLNPNRVVAATNLWAWTIPTHILYSPVGQTLYRSTGFLPGNQIEAVLKEQMQQWKKWSQLHSSTTSPLEKPI